MPMPHQSPAALMEGHDGKMVRKTVFKLLLQWPPFARECTKGGRDNLWLVTRLALLRAAIPAVLAVALTAGVVCACKQQIKGAKSGYDRPPAPSPGPTWGAAQPGEQSGTDTEQNETSKSADSNTIPKDSKTHANSNCQLSTTHAQQLATIARKHSGGGRASRGKCWAYVDDDIEALMKARGLGTPQAAAIQWPTMAAATWAEWALKNRDTVKNKMQLRAADEYFGKASTSLPVGAILIFKPGKCGFNATYGHVEIKISDTEFASDYIQTGRSCGPDYVFVPVKC